MNLFEVDGYFIRGDWTLQGQLSYGSRRAPPSSTPTVTGCATPNGGAPRALAAYKLTPRLEGVVRADYLRNRKNGGGLLGYSFDDSRNGIGPDPAGDSPRRVGANRYALSARPELPVRRTPR
jgi:hypothetical protein